MLAALLTTSSLLSSPVLVADHGEPRTVVISQVGATVAEQHAAEELASHLRDITGCDIPLRTNATDAPENAIIVGPGPVAKSLFRGIDLGKFGAEELVMKTTGHRLLLAGGRPRGTLYAVYRWLQNECGVRWWTPWATTIPHDPSLVIKPIDIVERPAFEARDPFWFSAFDGDWAVRNTSNSQSARLDETRGGSLTYGGFVHTYFPLVPPEKYFAKHPEWYSLIGGKRQANGAQLCTTNPELRDFIVDQVRAILKKNPNLNIVSVSQNDQFGPCECPVCKALDDAEGSHAATVLALANYVAEKIEKEFPNVAIDTLAYQYTRTAPKTLRPRPNVIVRLCSIECNFVQPLDHPTNESFMRDLRDWSRLTNRLYIWDYVTAFPNYLLPFANYGVLGPNLRLFSMNGVKGVFEEGAYQSNGAEMAEMRAWVLGQLLWDPTQDPRVLVGEFLRGYYGDAGIWIGRYLDQWSHAAQNTATPIWTGPTAPYFTFDNMLAGEAAWNGAEVSVADKPDFLWRVKIARLAPQMVWLSRWDDFKAEADKRGIAWPFAESKKEFAATWLALATGSGPKGWTPITHMNESGLTPQGFLSGLGL